MLCVCVCSIYVHMYVLCVWHVCMCICIICVYVGMYRMCERMYVLYVCMFYYLYMCICKSYYIGRSFFWKKEEEEVILHSIIHMHTIHTHVKPRTILKIHLPLKQSTIRFPEMF